MRGRKRNRFGNGGKRGIPKIVLEPNEILLNFATPGHKYIISRVEAGFRRLSRLSELGLLPGQEINVVLNNGGNVVIELRNVKYAISSRMASSIILKEYN